MITDYRLGELIAACHAALRRPDLDSRVRARVEEILVAAQARARALMAREAGARR